MTVIELTDQQMQALAATTTPPVVVDPKTRTAYVLVRKDLYERLIDKNYDDSPWSDEEMELLAWDAGEQAGWEEMGEYDHYPEKR